MSRSLHHTLALLSCLLTAVLLIVEKHAVNAIYSQGLLMHLKTQYPDWEPNVVVDIGANMGSWAHRVRINYNNTKILMIEATPWQEHKLKERVIELGGPSKVEYQIAVLATKSGETVNFYQDGNTGNSIFKEQSRHYQNSKPVQRTTTTLDDLVQQSAMLQHEPAIDFIKADVQGAELLVLQGGLETLAKASFIQLESSITEYNAGGSCFFEVDAFLRSKGFYWYEISDVQRNPEAFRTRGLGQFDVLYVNPSSPRLPDAFRELKGQYCGMNHQSTDHVAGPLMLSPNTLALMNKYGWHDLELALQQLERVTGKSHGWWSALAKIMVVVIVFVAGALFGSMLKMSSKSHRCRQ